MYKAGDKIVCLEPFDGIECEGKVATINLITKVVYEIRFDEKVWCNECNQWHDTDELIGIVHDKLEEHTMPLIKVECNHCGLMVHEGVKCKYCGYEEEE